MFNPDPVLLSLMQPIVVDGPLASQPEALRCVFHACAYRCSGRSFEAVDASLRAHLVFAHAEGE